LFKTKKHKWFAYINSKAKLALFPRLSPNTLRSWLNKSAKNRQNIFSAPQLNPYFVGINKKNNQYPDFGSSPSHPFVRGLRQQDFPSQLRDSDGIAPFFPSYLMII
jgi:hypothetical protein